MPAETNEKAAIARAFGAENRARLLVNHLETIEITPETAWRRVYELLLWIDRTTGLAHCYESDKCQPGRPWYGRSLAFHDWVSRQFDVPPELLSTMIDWLFRHATIDLARSGGPDANEAAALQRAQFGDRRFPLPGEDPELVDILNESLAEHLRSAPSDEEWQELSRRIRSHLSQENKRKNLLGEGFEDTLAAIIQRLPGAANWQISNRALLGDIPGFHPQADTEKRKRVDVAMWTPDGERRLLITSKWSVRADREEQFGTDFDAYVRVNAGRPFDYVLVTNEFDAARLLAACHKVAGNAHLFTTVVHVNPEGVLAAYFGQRRGAAAQLDGLVESGRLVSLASWLTATMATVPS